VVKNSYLCLLEIWFFITMNEVLQMIDYDLAGLSANAGRFVFLNGINNNKTTIHKAQ